MFWARTGSWPAHHLDLRHILAAFFNSFAPNFATIMVTFQGGYFLWNWWPAAKQISIARSSISLLFSVDLLKRVKFFWAPCAPSEISHFLGNWGLGGLGEHETVGGQEPVTVFCFSCVSMSPWAGNTHFLSYIVPVAPDMTPVCPFLVKECHLSKREF